MMKANPYVGITGAVTAQDVESVTQEFLNAGYTMDSPHIPMVGILVSHETLNGKLIPNRRYPPIDDVPSLVRQAHNVFPMIHYDSADPSSLADQVHLLFERLYEDGLCKAIQLNHLGVNWYPVDQVKLIKTTFPDMHIVLRPSREGMQLKDPRAIADHVEAYEDSLSYLLIDPSMGEGRVFQMEDSLAVYQELRERLPHLTIGFAGGFNGSNVAKRVGEIKSRTQTSDFCIDAEGRLRDPVSDKPFDDVLSVRKVREYLQSASQVLP